MCDPSDIGDKLGDIGNVARYLPPLMPAYAAYEGVKGIYSAVVGTPEDPNAAKASVGVDTALAGATPDPFDQASQAARLAEHNRIAGLAGYRQTFLSGPRGPGGPTLAQQNAALDPNNGAVNPTGWTDVKGEPGATSDPGPNSPKGGGVQVGRYGWGK
jgi:hypothetical protein